MMTVAERPTSVGNFGFGHVYVVYEDMWGGYKEYWDYYHTESEAQQLVKDIGWRELKIEEVEASTFYIILRDNVNFINRVVVQ